MDRNEYLEKLLIEESAENHEYQEQFPSIEEQNLTLEERHKLWAEAIDR